MITKDLLRHNMKIRLKDFDYCREMQYNMGLPEQMREYFDMKLVTVDLVNEGEQRQSQNNFIIKEDGGEWLYHLEWIESLGSVLPEHLFEI